MWLHHNGCEEPRGHIVPTSHGQETGRHWQRQQIQKMQKQDTVLVHNIMFRSVFPIFPSCIWHLACAVGGMLRHNSFVTDKASLLAPMPANGEIIQPDCVLESKAFPTWSNPTLCAFHAWCVWGQRGWDMHHWSPLSGWVRGGWTKTLHHVAVLINIIGEYLWGIQ